MQSILNFRQAGSTSFALAVAVNAAALSSPARASLIMEANFDVPPYSTGTL
jgi:hypothetical protein